MLDNAITTTTKNMQQLFSQKIWEKVLSLKLQILILDLERKECGIFLSLPCSAGWICLRMVVLHRQRIIRLVWGVVRLSGWSCCHYPQKLIDNHRGGRKLAWTIGCCQQNSWFIQTHDYLVRFQKRTVFIPYQKCAIKCCMIKLMFWNFSNKTRKKLPVELIRK